MDSGPTDEEWLSASASEVRGPQRAMIDAQIAQFKAMKQMNAANEKALYAQIQAAIDMAKAHQ